MVLFMKFLKAQNEKYNFIVGGSLVELSSCGKMQEVGNVTNPLRLPCKVHFFWHDLHYDDDDGVGDDDEDSDDDESGGDDDEAGFPAN